MPIEHRVSLISPIPSEEWIMRQYQSVSIPNVLFLVVLYLHKLIPELIVMQELIVMVSQYKMLLPLQVLQYSNSGLRVIARNVPKYEHMVIFLYNPIPILHQPVVIVPWTVQLVVSKRQVILCSANWIRVCLISKMNV